MSTHFENEYKAISFTMPVAPGRGCPDTRTPPHGFASLYEGITAILPDRGQGFQM